MCNLFFQALEKSEENATYIDNSTTIDSTTATCNVGNSISDTSTIRESIPTTTTTYPITTDPIPCLSPDVYRSPNTFISSTD